MSKIVEWFLLPLFFVMSILYTFNSLTNNSIELKKVYHHTTNDDTYLEKGTVSFYFSSEPQMKKKDDALSFFFPCVVSSQESEEMIQRINTYTGSYTIKIEKIIAPEGGITVTFLCDPQTISLSYELFDSIGMQKGIVFHLYNKNVLGTLQEKNNQPLLRMLSNTKKPSIALDYGHGGIDSGAVSCCGTITEKDICLAVGNNIAGLLRQKGHTVFLTRSKDDTVLLDERTFCANQCHADLFVSIHANYAHNRKSMGIETFCLQHHLLREQFSTLSADEKNNIAQYRKRKDAMSHTLALSIQNFLCGICYKKDAFFEKPLNRQVKFSVSQVLLGSQMPAVLVEIGFLSHDKEVQLLRSSEYQKFLAQRIVDGIIAATYV